MHCPRWYVLSHDGEEALESTADRHGEQLALRVFGGLWRCIPAFAGWGPHFLGSTWQTNPELGELPKASNGTKMCKRCTKYDLVSPYCIWSCHRLSPLRQQMAGFLIWQQEWELAYVHHISLNFTIFFSSSRLIATVGESKPHHSRFSLTECTLAASSTTRRGWPRAPGLISGLSAEFSIFGKDISATGVLQAQMSKKGLPQATTMQSTPDSPMPMSYYVSWLVFRTGNHTCFNTSHSSPILSE